jgi:signal transduction histidine kinase
VLGLFAVWVTANLIGQSRFPASDFFHGGLALATGWFAGERSRLRRQHIAELVERARRVEREAENERRLALAEERGRIARDLHDSAGHAINVIAILAGAARLRSDPKRSQRALATIEDLARDTVGELDQILHALREPGEQVAAPPGLASLDTLVAHHTSAGLAITLTAGGQRRSLPGTVDQAAFRILQEALTNAARHGTGTASVEVSFRETGVEIVVTNPVREGTAARPRGGHGLVGMRERAALTGGQLDAGAQDGAFRVHAALPYGR